MLTRVFALALLVAAVGCARAQVQAKQCFTLRAGAEERDRAACLRDQYPPSLDAGALAQARLEDLKATRRGDESAFEAMRLIEARQEFERRCRAWRRIEAESAARGGARPPCTLAQNTQK